MECFDHVLIKVYAGTDLFWKCTKCLEIFSLEQVIEMVDDAAERIFNDLRCVG